MQTIYTACKQQRIKSNRKTTWLQVLSSVSKNDLIKFSPLLSNTYFAFYLILKFPTI